VKELLEAITTEKQIPSVTPKEKILLQRKKGRSCSILVCTTEVCKSVTGQM